jgi:pilus assembly protein FimV
MPASVPAVPAVAAQVAQPASMPAPIASAPLAAASVAPPVVKPASSPAAAAPKPAPTPEEEASWLDTLSDNPLVLPGAGLVLAILAGLGWYRLRNKNKEEGGVSSFLESRLQPDSFFGASGGQRIDTRDASGAPSSMSYSLSQIDAIGDVDPVAEADVYLAYGRDLQAEEILKEAMRANPERLAIRTKLLEVYAKRRDIKGFELLAGELYGLTGGQGDEWVKAQEMGRSIDPENTLYEPGGMPQSGGPLTSTGMEPLGASTMPQSVVPSPSRFEHSVPGMVDLGSSARSSNGPDSGSIDLDISAPSPMDDPEPLGTPSGYGRQFSNSRPAMTPPAEDRNTIDFSLQDFVLSRPGPASVLPSGGNTTSGVDFSNMSLDLDPSMLDRSDIEIDAPTTSSTPFDVEQGDDADPLSRKIELADEFRQIGDADGARDLLQEVIEKADGALKARAQAMLASLS